ncbi:MAG: hypothetical protein V1774_01805 [Candidatus Eisenbacteria bacterium]
MKQSANKIRRFGGRWVREGQQFEEHGRVLRLILGRFWYLLVPFIGIMCANDSYVRPDIEDIKNINNLERKDALDEIDDMKAKASGVQTEYVTVEAEIDTLYSPRILGFTAVVDSLKSIRILYDGTVPATRTRIDSLKTIFDQVVAENEQLARVFRSRSTTLDSLSSWSAQLGDSILVLDDRVAKRTDHLYRVRNPKDYKRKEALFTGEGEYPRRDENPPREGK